MNKRIILLTVVCVIASWVGWNLWFGLGFDRDISWHLRCAAEHGYIDQVARYIKRGADVNARDSLGGTALHRAVRHGHRDVVELLVRSGADVSARDKFGSTPMEIAEETGNKDISAFLASRAAETNPQSANFEWVGADEEALHRMAGCGRADAVRFLISRGVDVNALDKYHNTPLYYAAESGNKEIAEILIANGADINRRKVGVIGPEEDQTAIFAAVFENQIDMVLLLLSKGADINTKDAHGETPLFQAASVEMVKLLLSKGADVNMKNASGKTPLDYAEEGEIADLLRQHGGKSGKDIK